jgi:mannose-6-phosphate isomerase
MSSVDKIYKIKGVVQHYTWGGYDFIPSVLHENNRDNKPYAEYWLGAHPKAAATIIDHQDKSLLQEIEQRKQSLLGERVDQKFHSLPYLLKLLDVKQMLSIQVHPDIPSAIKGFDEEEMRKISLTAFNRNYKDRNHKPEMMVALSDFWLLHGFKAERDLVDTLNNVPELKFLVPVFQQSGYKGLYEKVMSFSEDETEQVLTPLLSRIVPLYKNGQPDKQSADFWAARAADSYCTIDHYDKGIFSVYFLNLLHLKKGEGIFQGSGIPHAYLEGQNVEVMANSDNVLRAGLTDKHIDVAELMKHVIFEPTIPNILHPDNKGNFHTPAEEFALTHWILKEDTSYKTDSAETVLCMEGQVIIGADSHKLTLERGEAIFIAAGTTVSLSPLSTTELYRVYTP